MSAPSAVSSSPPAPFTLIMESTADHAKATIAMPGWTSDNIQITSKRGGVIRILGDGLVNGTYKYYDWIVPFGDTADLVSLKHTFAGSTLTLEVPLRKAGRS